MPAALFVSYGAHSRTPTTQSGKGTVRPRARPDYVYLSCVRYWEYRIRDAVVVSGEA